LLLQRSLQSQLSACQIEAGELIAARLKEEDMIELGELLDDQLRPRTAAIEEALRGDITVWKSVGLAPQDSMIATLVLEKAEELGVGTVIEDYDRED
jgi:ornithine cyclodeaminase/alanine dehydrogenase-like protein (mu-crystallin family)